MVQVLKFLAFIPLLLLSSCFDLREEIWIDSRGGGRLQFDYVLPVQAIGPIGGEKAIRERIDAILRDVPELKLDELEIQRSETDFTIHAELSTDSMLSLSEIRERPVFQELPPTAHKLAGTIDFEIQGTDVVFNRQIDVGSALGFAALVIPAEDRAKRRTTYIIHLPKAATNHNATRTENSGQTLIWDQTLGEALRSPTNMNFVAPLPIPWTLLTIALITLVALLILLTRWLKRRKRQT